MKSPIKIAFISALVFPGVGHLVLKRYKAALVLLFASLLSLFIIVAELLKMLKLILSKIENDPSLLEVMDYSRLAKEIGSVSPVSSLASWVLIVLWIYGVLDSYKQAKKLRTENVLKNQS